MKKSFKFPISKLVTMKDWTQRPTDDDDLNENLLTDDELNTSQKVKPTLMHRIRKNKASLSPTIEQRDEEDELEHNYQNIVKTDPRTY